ncbi:unnamed protein product [Linum trigynum]|uniref:Uncharacterized protein n=1 Tax=Linum trigynum TaxID=586398 RepID=A0AAV2GTF9_9ROSI
MNPGGRFISASHLTARLPHENPRPRTITPDLDPRYPHVSLGAPCSTRCCPDPLGAAPNPTTLGLVDPPRFVGGAVAFIDGRWLPLVSIAKLPHAPPRAWIAWSLVFRNSSPLF